ncbi:MAG: shikimate kinase [Parvularculaceae bacterium]
MPSARRKPLILPGLDRPIALVGMMGAGKTTVGRRLASALGLPFFDADAEIEAAAGMTVSELFSRHGEESFRRGEAKVIKRLVSGEPSVIATGGGAVTTASTRKVLKDKALTIWIRADVATLVKRATRRPTRPLLRQGDPHATIARLLEERAPYYAESDISIDSQPGAHVETVNAIIKAIETRLEKEEAS